MGTAMDDGKHHRGKRHPDGFVAVPTDIVEALLGAALTGLEVRIVLCVLRKTVGWDKAEDALSHSQIGDATGTSARVVARYVQGLVKLRVLSRTLRHGKPSLLSVSPPTSWEVSHRAVVSHPGVGGVYHRAVGDTLPPGGGSTTDMTDTPQQKCLTARAGADSASRVGLSSTKSSTQQTDPNIHEVIAGYCRLYGERHAMKPTVTRGKDGEVVKRMLSACGGSVEEVLAVIETGVDSQDSFLAAKGFTLGALWSNWQGLQLARKGGRRHGEREARRAARARGPADGSEFSDGIVADP